MAKFMLMGYVVKPYSPQSKTSVMFALAPGSLPEPQEVSTFKPILFFM